MDALSLLGTLVLRSSPLEESRRTMSAPARTQELHSRIGDGILVRLLWRAHDDGLFVTVADSKEDVEFCIEVRDRARALDVFHHPFADAAD
jgi:hypothetical protein